MSSKSTGHGAIKLPDIPRFQRCADAKSGGSEGIIHDSRHDPIPTAAPAFMDGFPAGKDFAWKTGAFRLERHSVPAMQDFALDRTSFSIGSFADEPDDLEYWMKQTPETRLAGIEFLRRQFFSYGEARSELRRFLEIAQRPRR